MLVEHFSNAEVLKSYAGKKVFVTGHTGFKGSWLSMMLIKSGAKVKGYSLAPVYENSLFELCGNKLDIESQIADIREADKLKKSIIEFQPEYIFHLAAQPLVRYSYQQPIETFEVNIMGTANVLEAMRS
ncbi:MAG TPA: GDP-mannose 4,6-dehydratase, partial [Bacteroidia bacterium]|nr:GDP-mannose 4,6-dehydratase [Bacteroidia bacterium]